MTTSPSLPPFSEMEPLRSDADVLERVETLVGPASATSTLWLLFVDGDGRQAPTVMPIDGAPRRPDGLLDGLARMLGGVCADLATDAGPGSVIFVRERLGPGRITAEDRVWGTALAAMCARTEVTMRGALVSTPRGVQWLSAG